MREEEKKILRQFGEVDENRRNKKEGFKSML